MISGVSRFAVVTALLLFSAGSCRSAVSLNVQLGFGGIFRLGTAFPLRVEVVNSGPATQGTLEVLEVRGGPTRGTGSYVLAQRRDLFLAAQSRKAVRLTVDPDTVSKPLRVSFRTKDRLVETEVTLRGHFTSQPLVLLLTRHNVSPVLPFSYENPVPVVSLALADLPVDARAYSGVWSMVLYEQTLRGVSPAQHRALDHWLNAGGVLLVLGGLHYALYQEPATASLLPVRVHGLKEVNGLPQLGSSYGHGDALRERFVVQDVRVVRGNVLVEESETPIWVEERKGQGRVAYLALDVGRPPISEWNGLGGLLVNVLGPPPAPPQESWSVWDRSVFTGIIENFGLISLGGSVAVFFVGTLVYLGGLVLWYQLGRKRHGRRPAVAVVWLAVLWFSSTVIGYWYFDRSRLMPDAVLISSTVIDGDPWSEDGKVHSNVGIFSTRQREFTFDVPKGWTHFEYIPSAGAAVAPSIVVRDSLRATHVTIPLSEWQSALFKVRARQPFPVQINWQKLPDHYGFYLRNRAAASLTECWLIVGDKAFELGDIPPGDELARQVAFSETEEPERLRFADIPFDDKTREVLLRKSIFAPEDRSGRGQMAYVIGWIQDAFPALEVADGRVRTYHYKLFRASIPLASEEDL